MFTSCVTMQSSNGLGLQAVSGRDLCDVTLQFPSNTNSKWVSVLFSSLFGESCYFFLQQSQITCSNDVGKCMHSAFHLPDFGKQERRLSHNSHKKGRKLTFYSTLLYDFFYLLAYSCPMSKTDGSKIRRT